MEIKVIFYLIAGAIYILSRVLKKKKPETGNWPTIEQEKVNTPKTPISKPTASTHKKNTFEDILRELSNEFVQPQSQKQEVVNEKPEEYIEEIKHPHGGVEPYQHDLTHEEKYMLRREHEQLVHESKETPKQNTKNKGFDNYQEDIIEPHPILKMIHEEGGASNAIILSEILNRKY